MSNFFHFLSNSIIICSGIFGFYASIRLHSIYKKYKFYTLWLFSTALLFLVYGLVLIPIQFMGWILNHVFNPEYLHNAVILMSSVMFLLHLWMLIRNFDQPHSIFSIKQKSPSHLPGFSGNHPSQLPGISEKSLFLLQQIYQLGLYREPLFSVEKAAEIIQSSEYKGSKDNNDDIPFSLLWYINYLRLLHYDQNSQSRFTKEANIFNAGFNTRASYYQWEKRKQKLSVLIDPILDYFDQAHNSNTKGQPPAPNASRKLKPLTTATDLRCRYGMSPGKQTPLQSSIRFPRSRHHQ